MSTKKENGLSVIRAILVMLLVCILPYDAQGQEKSKESNGPVQKIKVSKETTWFTEPLDENGEVDFWVAANRHYSKGSTVENNLAAAIVRTVDSYERTREPVYYNLFLLRLGVNPEELPSDLLVSFEQHCKDRISDEDYFDLADRIIEATWNRDDFPLAAEWIKNHSDRVDWFTKQLDKKTTCYCPLLSMDESSPLGLCYIHPEMDARYISRFLVARSMLKLESGDFDGCMADLISNRRLAFLLLKCRKDFGPTSASRVMRNGIGAEMQLLFNSKITQAQIKWFRSKVNDQQWVFDLSEHFDQVHRPLLISELISHQTGFWEEDIEECYPHLLNAEYYRSIRKRVNWNEILIRCNKFYDSWRDQLKGKPLREQYTTCKKIEQETSRGAEEFIKVVVPIEKWIAKKTKKSELFCDMLIVSSMDFEPEFLANAMTRAKARFELNRINWALHHYDHAEGKFPQKLAELKPAYLKKISEDPWSGKPFKYKKIGSEFVLYSVGADGEDGFAKAMQLNDFAFLDPYFRIDHDEIGLTSNYDDWKVDDD